MHPRHYPHVRPYGPRRPCAVPLPGPPLPLGGSLGLLAVLGTFIVLGSAALALFTVLAVRFMWALIVLPGLPQ